MKFTPGTRVGVLYGGLSAEREVSLKSGKAVGLALQELGFMVSLIDVDRDVFARLKEAKIEVAFIALHGAYGEDGTIQGGLEYLQIPYTGPGVMASSIAMNKVMTKRILLSHEILTPDYTVPVISDTEVAVPPGGYPLVVKPVAEGSSLGMSIVTDAADLEPALINAREFSRQVMIESYIPGIELTAAVLHGESLPLIEIRARGGVYDYQAKYTKGFSEYLVPAPLDESTAHHVKDLAIASARALGCDRGAVRVDFRLDMANRPYVIEINTVPGMTETSLLPQAAAADGMDFETLIDRILQGAGLDLATL
ncbi:MAG: D-alanine--D-alanine ligase [Deltaproteobacteria bacterium]|nr:MAG: D-alanine--D-alanine ligase [Deltaproteobacteria bacterium]